MACSAGFLVAFLSIFSTFYERSFATTCSVNQSLSVACDASKNPVLYPSSFSVFGAIDGTAYAAGQTLFVVALFPPNVCKLPQPINTNPGCNATVQLNIHSSDGSSCLTVPVAPSAYHAESQYGISFLSDPNLDTGAAPYRHWVFPVAVANGMYTSSLGVTGLLIHPDCSTPNASFSNLNLIPAGNSLLSPNVTVAALPPTIVNVYAGIGAGSYTLGTVMYIVVEFSDDVAFSPVPSRYSLAFQTANASYTLPAGLPYLELSSQVPCIPHPTLIPLMGRRAGACARRERPARPLPAWRPGRGVMGARAGGGEGGLVRRPSPCWTATPPGPPASWASSTSSAPASSRPPAASSRSRPASRSSSTAATSRPSPPAARPT